jgi:hypothetical protein
MNVEIGAEAAQFPEKEYVNGIAVAVATQPIYLHVYYILILQHTVYSSMFIMQYMSYLWDNTATLF